MTYREERVPAGRQRTARTWLLCLGLALCALLLAVPLLVWRPQIAALFADRAQAVAWVRGAGPWGPLLLMGLVVAQVLAAPIPGQALSFVAAYTYGFWLGSLYSWLGTLLGTAAGICLARWLGRPLVERLVAPAALARLDRLAEGQGLAFFFLIWLLPFLPDDLACFVAGLTRLPLAALIVTAAAGRLPGLLVAAWIGAHAERLVWQAWLAIGLASAAGILLVWRYGDRLQAIMLERIRMK